MADVRDSFVRASNDISKAAQDAAYVAIGLGVIGFQKAQVRRQEIQKLIESQISTQRNAVETPVADLRKEVTKALKEIDKTLGQLIERVDASFEPVADRLPSGAQAFVHQAREARDQLRGYLTSLAA
jgi:ABC-type transporter Mla subunit MlaD